MLIINDNNSICIIIHIILPQNIFRNSLMSIHINIGTFPIFQNTCEIWCRKSVRWCRKIRRAIRVILSFENRRFYNKIIRFFLIISLTAGIIVPLICKRSRSDKEFEYNIPIIFEPYYMAKQGFVFYYKSLDKPGRFPYLHTPPY
jgi:hypothetical protein